MGAGIAVCFADASLPVILIERDAEALAGAMKRVRGTYDAGWCRYSAAGGGEAEKPSAALSRTRRRPTMRCPTADLAIEAVFEDLDIKRKLFGALDAICPPMQCSVSNTSYLDLDTIGVATQHPQSVVGLHFFAPRM